MNDAVSTTASESLSERAPAIGFVSLGCPKALVDSERLITELKAGELTYKANGATQTLAVAWGFAEVLPEKVTILAETAERPQDIDVARAQKAKARAEERLKSNSTDIDYDRAEDSLQRAETRIKVAGEK